MRVSAKQKPNTQTNPRVTLNTTGMMGITGLPGQASNDYVQMNTLQK
jgi:hypothetical protein